MAGYRGRSSKTGKYGHVQFGFTHTGIYYYQVFFIAGATINCNPPIIFGNHDSVWTSRNVDVDSKTDVSNCAGMPVLPYS